MVSKSLIKEKVSIFLADTLFNYDTRRRINRFIKPNDKILDIGALASPFTKGLANQVMAIDILPEENQFGFSDSILERLKRRPNIQTRLMDAQNMEFEDSQFEIVILTEVLEHIQDDKKAANEIIRVLKPGGFLLLTVPHLERVPLSEGIKEHYRHYLKNDLIQLFGRESIIYLKDRFKFNEHRLASFFITNYNSSGRKFYLLFLPLEAILKHLITYIWLPVSEIIFKKKPGFNLIMVMRKK
jgi:SAM-dependent methyltransferase